MTQREFASLREGTWLYDAPLNFFLKAFVKDTERGVHCFGSGFFKLIEARSVVYNYESVRAFMLRQLNDYEDGIASLKQLFVPINISNTHWIFLRVIFDIKQIELYDSKDKNPFNRRYMETMRQFLYDEFHRDIPQEERPPYNEWSRE